MTDHQFDEFIRDRLRDYPSPVPENFWDRIQPKKDKDRKGFFFWFRYIILPGCLLAGIAAACFIIIRPSAHRRVENITSVNLPSSHSRDSLDSPMHYSARIGQSSTDSPMQYSARTGQSSADSPVQYSSHTRQPSADSPMLPSLPTGQPLHDSHTQQSSPSPATPPHTLARARSSSDSSILFSDTATSSFDHTPQSLGPTSAGYPTAHPSHSKATVARPTAPGNDSVLSMAEDTPPHPYPDNAHTVRHLNTRLPGIQPILHTIGSLTIKLPLKKASPAPYLASSPAKKDSIPKHYLWYLDAYISPDWPFANEKIASQEMKLSYTAGVKLTRRIGPHFSGTIGLQYSRINSQFSSSGDTLGLSDSLPLRRMSTIDIPLLIGYRINAGRFGMTINTGIIFNVYSYSNLYQHHTGLSGYLGLNLTEKISDRFYLFAEPYYLYRLSNMVEDRYHFSQKINVAGLSAGLRYNFKKPRPRK